MRKKGDSKESAGRCR